ncbi:MAG: FecCD family ABC transporter permease [Acidimicrobiales bacterium]
MSVVGAVPPEGERVTRHVHHPARLLPAWVAIGVVGMVAVAAAGLAAGPVSLPVGAVARELVSLVPGVSLDSGLTDLQSAIVTQIRFPRVVLALLVGAVLATSGAAYQGVFRNPLADPYLLGVASGAGFGATVAITRAAGTLTSPAGVVPVAAFTGALLAVGLAYGLGVGGGRRRSSASLILAGVAVAALFTALQTFLLQREDEAIRDVYAWLLGRFNAATWADVTLLLPYAVVSLVVLVVACRRLDVMAVGDAEAEALGLHPARVRLLVVVAASLGTAAAVAVSGLIGFVGIIVPHTVRLVAGVSYRRILPLAMVGGAAFLCLADLAARTVLAPAEIPIGVITALVGAPFFLLVMRTRTVVT